MRLALTADIHIGDYANGPTNSRFIDICDRIKELMDYVLSNNIKYLFIAGDIFKDKFPAPNHLHAFAKWLEQCQANRIETYIIPGNHDKMKTTEQIHYLGAFLPIAPDRIHIIDAPQIKIIEGQRFYIYPYMGSPQQPLLDEFAKTATTDDILVMHGIVEGCVAGIFEYEITDGDVISKDSISKFKMVLVGDIHDQQNFDNVYYPGSLERLTFNDAGEHKGFYDIDTQNINATFHRVNARKMITVNPYDKLDSVKDAIVRVKHIKPEDIPEIKRKLLEAGCFYISTIQTIDSEEIDVAVSQQAVMNVPDLIKAFAEKVGYKGDMESATKLIIDTISGV